jgi:hypothetical protein
VRRQLLTGTVTTLVVALLGAPLGLVWRAISPPVRYVVADGEPILANPESQALITTDGRFALLTVLAGVLCGVVAYVAAGRGTDVAVVAGLALGGIAAAVLTWRVGHQIGLDTFERLVARSADGTTVTGVADLRAAGVVVFWPIAAAGVFGLCEAIDFMGRHRVDVPPPGPDVPLPFGYGGGPSVGQPDQVGGDQLDLQSAPAGGDKDRTEP